MVDTNSDPRQVDFVIPSNDDASKSIDKILSHVTASVAEGLSDRKAEKDSKKAEDTKEVEKAEAPKAEAEATEVATTEAKTETPTEEK